MLRWPTIAPAFRANPHERQSPVLLSCCRIQAISAPRIRLGVQLLVMNSSEVWFRDLALAHRERVSQERFFFLGRGTCQKRICLFQVAGTLFTRGSIVPHVGHESVLAWISRPVRAEQMLLSCDDERHSILSVIFVLSRAITSTCALAIGHAQNWGPAHLEPFGLFHPGLPRGSSDSRFWILPQGAPFSCTALSPELASAESGIATFLDTACSLGEPPSFPEREPCPCGPSTARRVSRLPLSQQRLPF